MSPVENSDPAADEARRRICGCLSTRSWTSAENGGTVVAATTHHATTSPAAQGTAVCPKGAQRRNLGQFSKERLRVWAGRTISADRVGLGQRPGDQIDLLSGGQGCENRFRPRLHPIQSVHRVRAGSEDRTDAPLRHERFDQPQRVLRGCGVVPLVDAVDEQDRPFVVERRLREIPGRRSTLLGDPGLKCRYNRVGGGTVEVTAQEPEGQPQRQVAAVRTLQGCGLRFGGQDVRGGEHQKLDLPDPGAPTSSRRRADSAHSSTGVRAHSGSADLAGSRRAGRRVRRRIIRGVPAYSSSGSIVTGGSVCSGSKVVARAGSSSGSGCVSRIRYDRPRVCVPVTVGEAPCARNAAR